MLRNTSIKELDSLLRQELKIPEYQREYAWLEEDLEDLWSDLESTKESSDPMYKHFFGQVVVHADDSTSRLAIIDGQQRVTTSTILIKAFLDRFNELKEYFFVNKDSERNEDASRALIAGEDIIGCNSRIHDAYNLKPHLQQNDTDNEYFKKNILMSRNCPAEKAPKESQELMRKAYLYFEKKIGSILKDEKKEDWLEILNEYLTVFTKRFQVMYIEATKLEEAFMIFETLNARGEDLETGDLLKNYLFTTANDVNQAQAKWRTMINALDGLDLTKYIRYYWNSNHQFTREKALYRQITQKVRSRRESIGLLDELNEYAQFFHDLANPYEPVILDQNQPLINTLKGLSILKASSFYPILLAMFQSKNHSFSDEDFAKVAFAIEVFVFRNAAIAGMTANRTEVSFANIAKKIYDGDFAEADTIVKAIEEDMIDDADFKTRFETISINNKERIRYIFRKIHQHLSPNDELNINNMDVHIEHIMPQTITDSEWPNVGDTAEQKEEHKKHLWRLGNLCLLSSKLNQSISKKCFSYKKENAYKDSKIEPNNELIQYDDWDYETIEKRQEHLSDLALKIWPKI